MTTQTSNIRNLCKLALAASMLLGAAQWANAADKTPVADTKPSVQKGKSGTIPVEPPSAARGIKDPGVKTFSCKWVKGECVSVH